MNEHLYIFVNLANHGEQKLFYPACKNKNLGEIHEE